jgi:hypothetical protein
MNRRHLDRVTRAYLASARAFAPTQRTKGCASTKPLSHNPAAALDRARALLSVTEDLLPAVSETPRLAGEDDRSDPRSAPSGRSP